MYGISEVLANGMWVKEKKAIVIKNKRPFNGLYLILSLQSQTN
jgi:hypothetical protein